MAITPGQKRRGYVETDGYSDTHGFRKTENIAMVAFREDPEHVCKRWVWVDYLGDYYVSDYLGEHFARLYFSDEIVSYDIQEA